MPKAGDAQCTSALAAGLITTIVLAGCLLLCPTQPVAALEQILVTAAPNQ